MFNTPCDLAYFVRIVSNFIVDGTNQQHKGFVGKSYTFSDVRAKCSGRKQLIHCIIDIRMAQLSSCRRIAPSVQKYKFDAENCKHIYTIS
jgi:hypothetical protein